MSALKSDSSAKSSESVGSYSFIRDHIPRNVNCSGPDFVPDAKWWLNHYGLETGYSADQLNMLDVDAKNFAANYLHGDGETYGDSKLVEEFCHPDPKNDPALRSEPLKHLFSHRKSNGDSLQLGFESAINSYDAHLMGLDSCSRVLFEQPEKLYSDLDSHWIGVEKIEPWWHAIEKDEIAASLTSQTLSHHNKNCDDRGVQSMNAEKVSKNCKCLFNQYEEKSMDKEIKSLGKQEVPEPVLQESYQSCSYTSFGFSSKDRNNAAETDSSDTESPNCDLNRGELLEALCHSQTRAREAEKLAQEACDDKDHVINLFFQQASCLFAYRQWLHMLQLETLCLRLKSKDGITSFAPPSLLPWVRGKGVNLKKNRCRAAKKRNDEQRFNALAFAIGLGLVGAGLLVGWTIGWLFPAF